MFLPLHIHHMARKLLLFGLFMALAYAGMATHNRAGEITYTHLSGLTYQITITTYTKASSQPADRCELEVKFGDGDVDTIPRINGPASADCEHNGQVLGNDIKKNIYQTTHTYPGPGSYLICMNDPNRNADVLNIPNSVNTSFYLESWLVISPFGGQNSSPELTNAPVDNGCIMAPYVHNPGAVDPDGDQLRYSLIESRGENGAAIESFVYPNEVPEPSPQNTLTIDANNGTLIWDAPQQQGEYNIAIMIEEIRDGVVIGFVVRDMQITILPCSNNPPVIEQLAQICVTAGEEVNEEVQAHDEDGDWVTLEATGEPLLLTTDAATFAQITFDSDTVQGLLNWQTNCSHVRNQPYQVVVKATDNDVDFSLVDFSTIEIKVVSPAPENPNTTPQGSSMVLDWDDAICQNAVGYKVYRYADSLGYEADECITGVPASTGYQLIATVPGLENSAYTDNNGGAGLNQGQNYCYMVTAYFADGAESYPSVEFCGELMRDLPVPTQVTITATDANNGADTVQWTAPTELNATVFPGPYEYVLSRAITGSLSFETVASFGPENNLIDLDTVFADAGLNTVANGYSYRLELISNGISIGTSQAASSIYLQATPSDNTLTLSWEAQTPWINAMYYIYKRGPGATTWELIDSTTTTSYDDTGLTNGREFCYYVRSRGSFSSPGFVNPVINKSQELCAAAEDNEPPCPPGAITGTADCVQGETNLVWTNPNNENCSDDVVSYVVYFTPVFDQPFEPIAQLSSEADTTIFFGNQTTVAGCYAIASVDSFANESPISDTLCFDNCPVYELPNVFTPGGDGSNDFFVPFPYRHIDYINLVVYNRWGEQVFSSNDPAIGWDGRNERNGQLVPSGVYYYVCEVYEQRLVGLVPRQLRGFVQLINETDRAVTN